LVRSANRLLYKRQHYLVRNWKISNDLDEFFQTVEDLFLWENGVFASESSEEALSDVKSALSIMTVLFLYGFALLYVC
jgi:hypothetical protein